jgi:hypothetical protein
MLDAQIYDPSVPYPMDTEPLENLNVESTFKKEDGWADVWPHLRPDEKGYTFDSQVNKMLLDIEQMRYDRVLFRSNTGTWRPTKIEMLGNQRIGTEATEISSQIPLFPSDHFGLVTEFEWQN